MFFPMYQKLSTNCIQMSCLSKTVDFSCRLVLKLRYKGIRFHLFRNQTEKNSLEKSKLTETLFPLFFILYNSLFLYVAWTSLLLNFFLSAAPPLFPPPAWNKLASHTHCSTCTVRVIRSLRLFTEARDSYLLEGAVKVLFPFCVLVLANRVAL